MNAWDDATKLEALASGAVVLSFQVLNFWHTLRTARKVDRVKSLIQTNDAAILDAAREAHAALERIVVNTQGKDRRAPAPGLGNPDIIVKRDAAEAELQRRLTDRL